MLDEHQSETGKRTRDTWWRMLLVVAVLATAFSFGVLGTGTASAHATNATVSTHAQTICMEDVVPFTDWHVYEPLRPWLHHYWVRLNFSNPDVRGRIYYFRFSGGNSGIGGQDMTWMTEWLHPNWWGVSEAWAAQNPGWSNAVFWQLAYYC